MKTLKTKRSATLAAAAMAGTLLLSACGGSGGGGGDTTCKEFSAMETAERVTVLKDFAKQEGEDLADATDEELGFAADLLGLSCSMVKDDSVKLKDIEEGDFDEDLLGDLEGFDDLGDLD